MSEAIFHAIQRSEAVDTLRHTLISYFGARGFDRVGFGAPSRSEPGALAIIEHGYPAEMLGRYVENRLHLHDPALNRALAGGYPLLWRDVARQDGLTETERAVIGSLLDTDTTDGIAIPTFGRSRSAAIVNLSTTQGPTVMVDAVLSLYQAVAQQAHLRLEQIVREQAPVATLSPRERQILFWIAHNKSNTDIGTILAISPATIATYLKRIFLKLSANDRVTAVNRAVETGQIWI